MTASIERLKEVGFKQDGHWLFEGGKLKFEISHDNADKNVLYAFLSLGQVLYIGKTTKTLQNRMKQYRKPGKDQRTNIRNNSDITVLLQAGQDVEIWSLRDPGLLSYGGFRINLAAALEDSLIEQIDPPWNGKRTKIS